MHTITDQVRDYIELRPNYKASLGLVRTKNPFVSYLTWAAVNPESGHHFVPYLSVVEKLDPEAYWTPLTPEDLREHLQRSGESAFLLSDYRSKLAS